MSGSTSHRLKASAMLPLLLLLIGSSPASSVQGRCAPSDDHRQTAWPRPYEVREVDTSECLTYKAFVPAKGGFGPAELYGAQPKCTGAAPRDGEFIGRIGTFSYKYRLSGASIDERLFPAATRALSAKLRYTFSEPYDAFRGRHAIGSDGRLFDTIWSVQYGTTAARDRCNVDASRWHGDEIHTVMRIELNGDAPDRICAFRGPSPKAAPVLYIDQHSVAFGADAVFEGLRFKCKPFPEGFEQIVRSASLLSSALGSKSKLEERRRATTKGFAEAMQLARWLMTELKTHHAIETVEPPALKEVTGLLEGCPTTSAPK